MGTWKPRRFWFSPWGCPGGTQFARLSLWPLFITIARSRRADMPRFQRVSCGVFVRAGRGFVALHWFGWWPRGVRR